MNATAEKYSPYVVSLLAIGGVFLSKNHLSNFNQIFDQITTNALSVSGTLIGFFLTILTIINTISTRRMRFIKEAGLYPRLLDYLNTTIIWHLSVISICLFLPLIRQVAYFSPFGYWGKLFIILVVILSWTLSIRFVRIFIKLLHDPKPAKERDEFVPAD